MIEHFYRTSRPAMGSILTITLYGKGLDHSTRAADRAFSEVERIENLISFFEPMSEISRINRLAALGTVESDPEVVHLISQALDWSRRTRGAFDLTAAPLKRLWGFAGTDDLEAVPRRQTIEETLRAVGYRNVLIDPARASIAYRMKGVEIDLGAIGKGYGIDRAVDILRSEGIARALVSFGSTAYAIGSPPGGEGWKIGIQHPEDLNGRLGILTLVDRAVSTSGDYQQYHRLDGRRCSHVIDPRTGYPAPGILSATVVCRTAAASDALSTAAMVLGSDDDLSLLEDPGCEGSCRVLGKKKGRLEIQESSGWSRHLAERGGRRGIDRRGFLKIAGSLIGFALFGWNRLAADVASKAEDALKEFYPKADSIEAKAIRLTPAQMGAAQGYLGMQFSEESYTFYTMSLEGKPVGHAVMLDILGKERPITFLVAADPEGRVAGIEVLAYRESIGGEIRSHRFLDQFKGRTADSPMRLGREVQGITGATISSRSARSAVRKGLALLSVVFGKGFERAEAGNQSGDEP